MKLQAIMPLLGAAMTIAVCYSAGALLMARLKIALRRAEKLPLAIILGAACVQLALYAIFAARLVYKPLLLGLSAAVIGAAILEHRRRRSLSAQPAREFRWPENLPAFGYVMLFAVFTIFYFVNAWAPESSPDGSSYHLGLIAKYLRVHGFERVATNMYSGLGQGVELIYALAFIVGRHSAAALVHLGFAFALVLAIIAYGVRIGKWWVGAGAAVLVYASPIVGRDATTA